MINFLKKYKFIYYLLSNILIPVLIGIVFGLHIISFILIAIYIIIEFKFSRYYNLN